MVFWRAEKGWQVENTYSFGPNVVCFLLTLGSRRWYAVEEYIPPNDRPSLHCMEQGLKASPTGLDFILMGELNVRLYNPCDEREEDLATALADQGLVNMTDHFLSRQQYHSLYE